MTPEPLTINEVRMMADAVTTIDDEYRARVASLAGELTKRQMRILLGLPSINEAE